MLEGAKHRGEHDGVKKIRTVCQPTERNPETGREQAVDETYNNKSNG